MKQKLFAALTALALGYLPAAYGQSQIWENYGIVQVPPAIDNIDAVTFFNHKGASFTINSSAYFNTFDTLNFTNQGLMVGNPGFDFETIPTSTGFAHRAANFVNQNSGVGTNSGEIDCSGLFTFFITPLLPVGNLTGSSKCLVDATNIVNSGTINMSASSLIRMTGENVNLSRGGISMVNPGNFLGFFNAGVLDGYWGVGIADPNYRALVNPAGQASLLNPPNLATTFGGQPASLTDLYDITTRQSFVTINQLLLQNPTFYVYDSGQIAGTSNRMVLVVALVNTNSSLLNQVYFPTDAQGNPFEIAVQWQWTSTNFPTAAVSTNNYMYLTDDFGERTNIQLFIDGQAGLRPTYRPGNYNLFEGAPFVGPIGTPTPPATPVPASSVPFINGLVTNQYAAYQAIFTAATSLPGDVAGGNVTNMAGRIEVVADKVLDLTQARLASLNYLLLKSTNHYIGSKGAVITAPNLDLYLRTTNGALAITNLVAPYLNHLEGTCDLWSARWTNFDATLGITNSWHVLLVDSQIAPITTPIIQTCQLAVTNFNGNDNNNLLISDILNVSSNLLLNATRITLTTNAGNLFTPYGEINVMNPDMLWPTATPGLMYLTNFGVIQTENSVYFGGSHTQPPYNTNLVNIPYQAFVNHGGVSNQASLVWSVFFENDGIFDCGGGSFNLQQSSLAIVTNGAIYAIDGDIGFQGSSLLTSNSSLLAGGALSFTLDALLDDGSISAGGADFVTNKNFWSASGINLFTLPSQSSLLATTITNSAPDYGLVLNRWAAADEGATPAGFANNAAIGHLILDGQTNNLFEFQPVTGNNALYVDELDLRNFIASNVDDAKNYASIQIDPGMKIYYGQALADGVSIAERLNGKNGGGFVWVSNYTTGFFSSTNMVYPDGSTNRLNTALVTSCSIDSNGNGIPNCMDPAPITLLSASSLALSVTVTNQSLRTDQSTRAAMVSWTAFPSSTNYLYSSALPGGSNWQLVTNFVFTGRFPTRVTVTDLVKTNAPRFYRVRVSAP